MDNQAHKWFYCRLYLNTISFNSMTFILAWRFHSSPYEPNVKLGKMTCNKSVINWANSSQEGTYHYGPTPIRQVSLEVPAPKFASRTSVLMVWKWVKERGGDVWWSDMSLLILRLQHDGNMIMPPALNPAWTSMSTSTLRWPATYAPSIDMPCPGSAPDQLKMP